MMKPGRVWLHKPMSAEEWAHWVRQLDPQRDLVYGWEVQARASGLFPGEQWVPPFSSGHPGLSLDECRGLVEAVWADYRPTSLVPMIKDGRGTRTARGHRWRISLPRGSRIPSVVLHEIAHSILPEGDAGHGPVFARFVLELWVAYLGAERRKLLTVAWKWGVGLGSADTCRKPWNRHRRRLVDRAGQYIGPRVASRQPRHERV